MPNHQKLRSPFPYFGGKSAVSDLVWARFGDCRNYVEPFFGSGAVLLGRPHWPFEENRIETVNDADCHVVNFFRALQSDPESLADEARFPVNEIQMQAYHLWLTEPATRKEFENRMRDDVEFYDVRRAGRWVNGICQWIGSGWCHHPEWQQLPHLGDAGMGVHRPSQQLPHLGNAGRGVHRPSQQLPHLGDAGMGESSTEPETSDLENYLLTLADRLRRVRVCCGDWSRVCGPTPTVKQGLTGVFLDPPYADEANRKSDLYAVDSLSVAHQVREWAIANGDDPRLRIALCGYEGEHTLPDSWACVEWKARGGYGSQGTDDSTNGRENSAKERIWFSPHCVKAEPKQRQMCLIES